MSAPKRFFVEKIEKETLLSGEEFSHAKNVLRLREGDELILLDGSGKEYDAIVNSVGKKEMICGIVGERIGDKESKTPVKLLIGALKGDKTELVVQKATELGVAEIGVFSSKFCSAYMNDNKLARLNKVAHEAAKQCLRSRVPEVFYYQTLESALASCTAYPNKLFACEFAQKSDTDLHSVRGGTALVVGSEGGFSEEEFELAKTYGFSGVTLGKRILRAETAAIVFTGLITFILGDLG